MEAAGGPGLLSLTLLGAFVAWSALSITWADAGGHALEATNKLLLALATAFLFAITPWTERRARWLLTGFVAGVTVASVATLASATFSGHPSTAFIEARFAEPMGYAGASTAFAAMVVGPALAMSARLSAPLWSRAVLFAVAVVQVELALLPQSRGVFLALAGALLALLIFSPNRGWVAIRALAAGLVVALTVSPILDVFTTAAEGRPVNSALHAALGGVALAAAIALVVGALLAYLEPRRAQLTSPTTTRRAGFAALAVLCVAVVVVVAAFGGRIGDSVSSHWGLIQGWQGSHQPQFTPHIHRRPSTL